MTALVREWLLGITGAAILAALAEGVMPEGGVKQAGKLVCGLVLLAAVLQPLARETGDEGIGLTKMVDGELQVQQLQQEVNAQMRAVIEDEMAAYSMDKAAQLGLKCRVRVTCTAGEDGIFLPEQVIVWGVDPGQRQGLADALEEDLGLEAGQILFQEGETP